MFRLIFVTVLGTCILLVPLLVNGSPLFYLDSAAYIGHVAVSVSELVPGGVLAGADKPPSDAAAPSMRVFGRAEADGLVYSGRSVYYGALAYLGWITSIWLPVVVQAAVLSALVVALCRRVASPVWETASLGGLTLLTFGSSAAYFAGLVMPDIWAGMAILALALLWSEGPAIPRAGQVSLFVILAFSALAHQSHLALIVAMIGGYLVVRRLPVTRLRQGWSPLLVPMLAVGAGVAGIVAFSLTVTSTFGAPPVSRPMITAHLVDMGPGTAYARSSCPESDLVLCDYLDRLPTDWISFLFSLHPERGVLATLDVDEQRALAAEQTRFFLETLEYDPGGTLGGLLGDGVRQIAALSLVDVAITERQSQFLARNFPADLVNSIQTSLIYERTQWPVWITRLLEVTTAASLALLPPMLWYRRHAISFGALSGILAICLGGLLANALICGILASPYGRFQARIVWIVPLLLVLALAARHVRKGEDVADTYVQRDRSVS